MSASALVPPVTERDRSSAFFTRKREYLIATGIFLALTVLFFNPVFRGFTFSDVGAHQNAVYPWKATPNVLDDFYPQSDQADTYYPWQVFISRTIRAGSVPLWNPHNFGGQPFLANGQNGVFYPPKLLLSVLVSADWAHDLLVILSVFLSGLTMFALLKEYGSGFAGALLAGTAWMFNSYNTAWLHFEIAGPVAVFLPLAVFYIYRSAIRRSWRLAIAAGAMLGLIFLGSSVLYGIVTSVACGLYAFFLSLRPLFPLRRPTIWQEGTKALLRLALILFTMFGVCAIEVLPAYVLAQHSARANIPYDTFASTMQDIHTFLHVFRAQVIPTFPNSVPVPYALQRIPLLFTMVFSGVPTALFAVIAFFQRRPGVTFGRALVIGTFLVLSGTPVTRLAYQIIPGFKTFLGLGRALFLWDFAIALLGGIGLDAFFRWCRNPQRPSWSDASRSLDAEIEHRERERMIVLVAITALTVVVLALHVQTRDRWLIVIAFLCGVGFAQFLLWCQNPQFPSWSHRFTRAITFLRQYQERLIGIASATTVFAVVIALAFNTYHRWLVVAALLCGISLIQFLHWYRNRRAPSLRKRSSRALAFLRQRQERLIGVASATALFAIVITTAQLGVYGRVLNPPFPPRQSAYLYPATPLIKAIAADRDHLYPETAQRFITVGASPLLYASHPMLFGFESVGGYDSLIPQRTAALLQVIAGNTPEAASEVKLITAYTPSFVPKTTRFDLLPRLGITTMVVPPNVDTDPAWNGERVKPLLLRPLYLGIDGQVITIVSPKPVSRAYVVHDAQFASTPLDALQQFVAPGFEYSQRVILETPVDAARSSAPSPNADASPAVKYDGPNHVSIDVTTTAPGWVVLTDMWGPGWHATMNGKATDVLHANYAFRAVRVPAGQTHIDMRYQPTEFTVGAAITSATIVAIGVVFIVAQVYRWRKKRLATTEAL